MLMLSSVASSGSSRWQKTQFGSLKTVTLRSPVPRTVLIASTSGSWSNAMGASDGPDALDALVPGAACGAAAAACAEYTLPGVSQTVIITRTAGRTPVPERESIRSLAAHQATMVLFLSTSLTEKLQGELLAGGYGETTPAAVVYKATWPEEKIFRCTVGTLHETVTGNGLTKTSLIVVGNCLGDTYLRSLLYHPNFTTEFRKGAQ